VSVPGLALGKQERAALLDPVIVQQTRSAVQVLASARTR